MSENLLQVKPRVVPPLDADFRPAYLGNRAFLAAARESGRSVPVAFALQRPNGSVSVYRTLVLADGDERAAANSTYAERVLKFLLWQKGSARVLVSGPPEIVAAPAGLLPGGRRASLRCRVHGQRLRARLRGHLAAEGARFPEENESSAPVGRHLDGCRIGFDAGGSDRKVAAVIDGKEVFSCEVVWEPEDQRRSAVPLRRHRRFHSPSRRAPAPHRRHRRELGGRLHRQQDPRGFALSQNASPTSSSDASRPSISTSPRSGAMSRSRWPTMVTSPRSRAR